MGWSTTTASRSLLIDRLGPKINLTSHNNNTNLIFKIDDDTSGVSQSWWVSDNKNGNLIFLGSDQYSLNSKNLNLDYNNLEIYANDTVGNDNNVNYTIYVDAFGLVITLNSPDQSIITNQKNVRFTATDNYSPTFSCSAYVNSGLDQTSTVNNNSDNERTLNLITSDNSYDWNIQCLDNVGN